MVQYNLIPKDLAVVDQLVCPWCAHDKAHHRPWRYKGFSSLKRIIPTTMPVQRVSVYQQVSPIPGFVPTHHNRSTLKIYVGPTVFVDYYSDITYHAHLMFYTTSPSSISHHLAIVYSNITNF